MKWSHTKWLAPLLVSMCVGPSPAPAEEGSPMATACAPISLVKENLKKQYGEEEVALGLSGERMISIYSNVETGSATILSVDAKGIACFVTGLTSFYFQKPRAKGIDG